MKRLAVTVVSLYVLAALASKVIEHFDGVLCECSDECWCKRPGLSVFRWVFPRWHKGPAGPENAH